MATVIAVATLPFRLVGSSWTIGETRIRHLIDYLDYETSSERKHPHLRRGRR